MARFRLRSIEVNAFRFRPGLEDEWAHLWRDGVLVGRYRTREAAEGCPNRVSSGFFGYAVPVIVTPTGRVAVHEGNWVVTNARGERTVVEPAVFDQLYESVALPEENDFPAPGDLHQRPHAL